MKKIILILLAIGSIVNGYGNITVANYSDLGESTDCDTSMWIQTHIEAIHKMTRKDWLKVSEELSMPIYLAFTPEQKRSFWLEKVNEVMALDGWSAPEKEHINKLITFLNNNPDIFDSLIRDADNKSTVTLFFENWTDYAISTLGWSKNTIAAIIGKGNVMIDKTGKIKSLKSYEMKNIPLGN